MILEIFTLIGVVSGVASMAASGGECSLWLKTEGLL